MNEEQQTELAVEGMICRLCILRIKRTLSEVEGVSGVQVKLAEGKVIVLHEGRRADKDAMVEALQYAGYEAVAA